MNGDNTLDSWSGASLWTNSEDLVFLETAVQGERRPINQLSKKDEESNTGMKSQQLEKRRRKE
jgi:hypothetical protein